MINEIDMFVDELEAQFEEEIVVSSSRDSIGNTALNISFPDMENPSNEETINKPRDSSDAVGEHIVGDYLIHESELIGPKDSIITLVGSYDLKKKLTQLPLARVKSIIKQDKDNAVMGQGVVFLISKSTELFIQTLARDSHIFTTQNKKKTIQMRDIESAISHKDYFAFLEGAL